MGPSPKSRVRDVLAGLGAGRSLSPSVKNGAVGLAATAMAGAGGNRRIGSEYCNG